jgi:uncharacterized protein YdaU (DUF1376 family)
MKSIPEFKMNSLEWFPFFPGDWLSSLSVISMTPQQKGWYVDMLCHQWKEGGYISLDRTQLLALFRVTPEQESEFNLVLEKFLKMENGKYANERLLTIYKEQTKKHEARKHAGSKGGLKQCLSNAQAIIHFCSSTTSLTLSSLNTVTQEKKKMQEEGTIGLFFSSDQKNSQNFCKDWDDWISYRVSNYGTPRNPVCFFQRQIDMLKEHSISDQIGIIKQSLTNGWQGLFPVKGSGGGLKFSRSNPVPEHLRGGGYAP